MRVLVIGGTRFIGAAAVHQLAAAGHKLCLFHRGNPAEPPAEGVQHIRGDRNAIADYAAELMAFQPDVVLDMVCITEAQCAASVAALREVARRYVLVSSCDVYRVYGVLNGSEEWPIDNTPQTEDAPLRTKLYPYRGAEPRAADDPRRIMDDYDKIPCEQLVLDTPGLEGVVLQQLVLDTPGLEGVVLRLPMVYGPRDYQMRLLPYLRRMDDGREAILLGETLAEWQTARGYVEDVAAAICLGVVHPQAAGKVYNIAEAETLTEAEWIWRIGAAAEWQGEVVAVPDTELPEELAELRGSPQHLVIDSSAIRNELGYREIAEPPDAMEAGVEWQRKNYPAEYSLSEKYVAEDATLATLG